MLFRHKVFTTTWYQLYFLDIYQTVNNLMPYYFTFIPKEHNRNFLFPPPTLTFS